MKRIPVFPVVIFLASSSTILYSFWKQAPARFIPFQLLTLIFLLVGTFGFVLLYDQLERRLIRWLGQRYHVTFRYGFRSWYVAGASSVWSALGIQILLIFSTLLGSFFLVIFFLLPLVLLHVGLGFFFNIEPF